MAFPVPSHLPRKKDQDVSTRLLSKMSETSFKLLTYEVASTWVAELDTAIRQTKDRIHERIQSDLPAFDTQLSTAKSVQERLQSLSSNVDSLSRTLSDPESGLVPHLITELTRHAALAQETLDADVRQTAVLHLSECRSRMQRLELMVHEGHLPEAMAASTEFEQLLSRSPAPLQDTALLNDLKRTFRAARDRTDEQLNDAYSHGIMISSSEMIIRPSVQVRASETVLALSDVVKSLSSASLATLMTTLRRDLTTYYIHRLFTQPALVEVSSITTLTGDIEHKLTVVLAPPHSDIPTTRIDNVSSVLTFLDEHLFPHLPPSTNFATSLVKPISSALLNELLIPSLPSKAEGLPEFLQLLVYAVSFEKVYIGNVLHDANREKDVKLWADAIPAHYERKRRIQMLEQARTLVMRADDEGASFFATFTAGSAVGLAGDSKPIQTPERSSPEPSPEPESVSSSEDSAWGFDEDGNDAVDENGWGLEDEQPLEAPPSSETTESAVANGGKEEDGSDAWGWNDDEEQPVPVDEGESTDSSAWDDPWGDSDPMPAPQSQPKTATRLAKLSSKGKGKQNAPDSVVVQSPVVVPPPPPTPATTSTRPSSTLKQAAPETESYLVSGRAKDLLSLVDSVLVEAAELASSGIFNSYTSSSSPSIGFILYQAATQVLELYRALYVVVSASRLSEPECAMRFSNDCLWINEQVCQAASRTSVPAATTDRLREDADVYQLLSESWYDDTLTGIERKINTTLDEAQGFVGTTDQDVYDACEAAVNQVLRDIRHVSQQFKPVLRKSKYYQAVGSIVNTALSRLLADILAIPDITEVESHNLSEICRIFNALEGLFVEDPSQPSFVVAYVPSWLKFSYLSELLEASIADISYLFEEGALVDFEIQELVNLVRALFADTPLRANTINKLMQAHPPVAV